MKVGLVYMVDEEYKTEKVHAVKTGNYYQLKSVPAFANGVAYDDIISVELEDNTLFFDELIESSGHSVIHIVIFKTEVASLLFEHLRSLGVNVYSLHNNQYFVIDVPPFVNYKKLRSYLLSQLNAGLIDVSEAKVSEVHFKNIAEELG